MSDYAMTGKKGTGKSKNAVLIIRDQYLKKGRAVASNLDLNLSKMLGPYSRATYVRIPDKPTAFDLLSAGHGNPDSYDEDFNGALVLDECGTWLNSRSFGDKDRAAMLDFLAHGRKHGWDTFYIMQDVAQVDKQLRESFIEYTTRHRNYRRVKWPMVGGLLGVLFGEKAAFMPPFHTAVTRIGFNPQDLKTDSKMFRGQDIEACYDTRQVFMLNYAHGAHSILSPWHMEGRFMPEQPLHWSAKLRAWFKSLRSSKPPSRPVLPLRPLDPAFERFMALVTRLEPEDRLRLTARYLRESGRTHA